MRHVARYRRGSGSLKNTINFSATISEVHDLDMNPSPESSNEPVSSTLRAKSLLDDVVGDNGLLGASRAEFGGVSRVVFSPFPAWLIRVLAHLMGPPHLNDSQGYPRYLWLDLR